LSYKDKARQSAYQNEWTKKRRLEWLQQTTKYSVGLRNIVRRNWQSASRYVMPATLGKLQQNGGQKIGSLGRNTVLTVDTIATTVVVSHA
jgi:hypothetical protein